MPDVLVERDIPAPAAVCWGLVSDVTRTGEWSPETTGCEWLAGASGPAVGARFRGRNEHGKKRWSTMCTVVACEPDAAFAFEVTAGGMRVSRWEYRFASTGDGCRASEQWTDQRGRIVTFLGKFVSGVGDRAAHNRSTMERTLERLDAVAQKSK